MKSAREIAEEIVRELDDFTAMGTPFILHERTKQKAVSEIEAAITQDRAELLGMVKKLKGILRQALSDDKFNDHSSGIWQMKAKQVLKDTMDFE